MCYLAAYVSFASGFVEMSFSLLRFACQTWTWQFSGGLQELGRAAALKPQMVCICWACRTGHP